jgi:hypothetical protein
MYALPVEDFPTRRDVRTRGRHGASVPFSLVIIAIVYPLVVLGPVEKRHRGTRCGTCQCAGQASCLGLHRSLALLAISAPEAASVLDRGLSSSCVVGPNVKGSPFRIPWWLVSVLFVGDIFSADQKSRQVVVSAHEASCCWSWSLFSFVQRAE